MLQDDIKHDYFSNFQTFMDLCERYLSSKWEDGNITKVRIN